MIVKLNINDEYFEFDFDHMMMAEGFAYENATGMRYTDLLQDVQSMSLKALAALAWLGWRRGGRDVQFASITAGETDVDLAKLMQSFVDSLRELVAADPKLLAKLREKDPDLFGDMELPDTEAAPDPTVPLPGDPAGSPTTPPGTSLSSPATTESGPGKSGS